MHELTTSFSGSEACLDCFLRGKNRFISDGPDSSTAVTGSWERRRGRGDLLGESMCRLSVSGVVGGVWGGAGVWSGVTGAELVALIFLTITGDCVGVPAERSGVEMCPLDCW